MVHCAAPFRGIESVEDDNELNLKRTKFIAMAAIVSALSACSFFQPYQPELKQGNYIRQEQLQQLETGMSPDQVQFLLGTPMLTGEQPEQRWVYPIQEEDGQYRHLEVEFEGGQVVRIKRS